MIVHLIDGTYEFFRHFYGLRRFTHVKGSASRGVDRPYGAVVGVLQSVLQIIETRKAPPTEQEAATSASPPTM